MEAEFEILNALKKSQEMITNDSPRVNTNRAIRFDNHTELVLRILRYLRTEIRPRVEETLCPSKLMQITAGSAKR